MSGSLEALPSATNLLRNATPALNPRIPPIARQNMSILPCRIAIISRNKLRKESLAKNPDLRRCAAHNSLLRRSMEEAHHNIRKRLSSLSLEHDEVDGPVMIPQIPSESQSSIIRSTINAAVKAMTCRQRSEGLLWTASSSQEPDEKKPLVNFRRYCAPSLRVHRPAG
ncbi:hypothetical protein KXX16_005455 [Aspergillus fumigatus]|jgi:hypothetical protein|uniref:Uncharacterized protein n=2 Tax=Aspergillus fumigatus TaxID=746128 RepID=Q4WC16_ASPFU|nr:hypothetical protein AFUA_8G06040 [Aspergillus fumigatus Af293]KAF4294169.1 hypothetical protein CNMCM8686_004117 [Aspergillus fumigatus]EAL85368.1 hypothetical protein AFUA_8G06040 [Aspergillus fumigatus Af293]KAH1341939.1 hypothetical protein KXX14_006155 [Aspergillus fumigatus]KAH1402820.1 hypothetical protein KXX51_002124 [Aspergillus fumigatus]KAH1436299.1 hypothetical protein KXX32_006535 [Aspergillus fumigatus]